MTSGLYEDLLRRRLDQMSNLSLSGRRIEAAEEWGSGECEFVEINRFPRVLVDLK